MADSTYAKSIDIPVEVFKNLKNAKRFALDIGECEHPLFSLKTSSQDKLTFTTAKFLRNTRLQLHVANMFAL